MSPLNKSVKIYNIEGKISSETTLPEVFQTPVRDDLIQMTFKNMRMNTRQAYAVSPTAGKRHSARSLGPGRALARVPRVKASGTRRSGQAAEANFARGGRMACPTTVQRKWKRMTPQSIRKLTTAMGISASSMPSMVQSRGHKISKIEQIPVVLSDEIKSIEKTTQAANLLSSIGFDEELEKVKDSRFIRAGRGKSRNRKYVEKKGPLLVHNFEEGSLALKSFLNIKGLEVTKVDSLSVLSLCPGGFAGRLIIWTSGAFEELRNIKLEASEVVENLEVENIFYSEEVQSFINEPILIGKPELVRGTKSLLEMNLHFDKF